MRHHVNAHRIEDQRLFKIISAEVSRYELFQMVLPVNAGLALPIADKSPASAIREDSPYNDIKSAISSAGCLGSRLEAAAFLQSCAQFIDIGAELLVALSLGSRSPEHQRARKVGPTAPEV